MKPVDQGNAFTNASFNKIKWNRICRHLYLFYFLLVSPWLRAANVVVLFKALSIVEIYLNTLQNSVDWELLWIRLLYIFEYETDTSSKKYSSRHSLYDKHPHFSRTCDKCRLLSHDKDYHCSLIVYQTRTVAAMHTLENGFWVHKC